ncbi:MAG: hypothetical protein HN712_21710 [Gemmatimonadetes bacterium]|jgi:2-phosphoglycerate kinase|nr:hypothetical protein [Gemmatimonadota bacterium]MBT7862945.1 hypothetical protein [Gemmatimonadota bacterium]
MADIIDGKKRIPFMRGMLVHHLIQQGFDHEAAYQVADDVRSALREYKEEVKRDELLELIHNLLSRDHADHDIRDLVFWEPVPTSITVDLGDSAHPFSRERLAHSVQAAGLGPDDAMAIARTVESRLLEQRLDRVKSEQLGEMVAQALSEGHGDRFVSRYQVWRAWGDIGKPLVLLIGGASGVGKTSLAINLANVLDIPRVVATDDIRQILRLTLSQEFMPSIHHSSYTSSRGVQLPDMSSEDPLITSFRDQARVVGVGVRAIISRCIEENTSVIVDGVHLIPGFTDLSQFGDDALIIPMCLAVTDRQVFKQRFARRAKQSPNRPEKRYLDNLDHILAIQQHILDESEEDNIPVIEITTVEDPTSAAVTLVAERLRKEKDVRQLTKGNGKKKRK